MRTNDVPSLIGEYLSGGEECRRLVYYASKIFKVKKEMWCQSILIFSFLVYVHLIFKTVSAYSLFSTQLGS